ncbi:hypothetical protein [Pedobacter chitinilyticus]|uniref:Uncharacterized protein n=1 Tax=Pedobacter chitinilyticus TaxID=2233776 RepID=A0A3S3PP46_9SPHI|nr:hypothetical protein [Pedobacter chitinilyticus]RWU08316.1 hypothetical protein DPV69_08030 [Pedobacter chitinilyticus]
MSNTPLKIATILFTSFIPIVIYAQDKVVDYNLIAPLEKIQNSPYQKIHLLDSRINTENFGIIQTGAFNTKAKLIPKVPLSEQLQKILDGMSDTKENGELLLQIRKLAHAELTKVTSEHGFFDFKANLYRKDGETYYKIAEIDTNHFTKGMDVTKKLMRNSSEIITDFIKNNLNNKPVDTLKFTDAEIKDYYTTERERLKLYSANKLIDGAYKDYNQLKGLTPYISEVYIKNDNLSKGFFAKDQNGNEVKLKFKDAYAIVYKGTPYILTDYGQYQLTKENNEFFFTGKIKVQPSASAMTNSTLMFGLVGALITSGGSASDENKYKIDYSDGSFIQIEK